MPRGSTKKAAAMMRNNWSRDFPHVPGLPASVAARLDQLAGQLFVRQGSQLHPFASGGEALLFLTSGCIRVHDDGKPGPHIRYVRADPDVGKTIVNACLIARTSARSHLVAQTDVQAVTLDEQVFATLLATSADFRAVMYRFCAQRVCTLLGQFPQVRSQGKTAGGHATQSHSFERGLS